MLSTLALVLIILAIGYVAGTSTARLVSPPGAGVALDTTLQAMSDAIAHDLHQRMVLDSYVPSSLVTQHAALLAALMLVMTAVVTVLVPILIAHRFEVEAVRKIDDVTSRMEEAEARIQASEKRTEEMVEGTRAEALTAQDEARRALQAAHRGLYNLFNELGKTSQSRKLQADKIIWHIRWAESVHRTAPDADDVLEELPAILRDCLREVEEARQMARSEPVIVSDKMRARVRKSLRNIATSPSEDVRTLAKRLLDEIGE